VIVLSVTFEAENGEIMVLMAFNRWVCRPRVHAGRSSEFGVLCCVYGWYAAAVEREVWKKGGGD
jgi:hypothetical protein